MLEIKNAVEVIAFIFLKHNWSVGDWHIKIIFTERNQYCARIFITICKGLVNQLEHCHLLKTVPYLNSPHASFFINFISAFQSEVERLKKELQNSEVNIERKSRHKW